MGEKITVDLQTLYDLAKTKAREEILKDYIESVNFVEKSIVETILGIKEEKGE